MFEDPEFWVALAFVIFLGILVKFGVPKMALSALDSRSDRIRQALDEAHRLRSEAQDVLAQYQKKRDEAEKEAQAIIENARIEAERLAAEAACRKVEERDAAHQDGRDQDCAGGGSGARRCAFRRRRRRRHRGGEDPRCSRPTARPPTA